MTLHTSTTQFIFPIVQIQIHKWREILKVPNKNLDILPID